MKILSLVLLPLLLSTGFVSAQTGDSPTGLAGSFSGSIQTGGGTFDPFERNATRSITDIVVPGAVVPFTYTRTWNSRKGAANVSDGYNQNPWVNNWCWTVTMNQNADYEGPPVNPNDLFYGYYIAYPDGKVITFNKPTSPLHSPPGGVGTYTAGGTTGVYDKFVIVTTSTATLTLTDGTVINFTVANSGYTVQATSVVDPYGRKVTLTGDFRTVLSTATEPGGRWIQMSAPVLSNNNQTVTTTVTTSQGQSVNYVDNFPSTGTNPYLGSLGANPTGTPNPSPTPNAYSTNAYADSSYFSTGTSTVTYNNVIDPATNQPVQANYTYKLVQPPQIPPSSNPSDPPPPSFYRLVYADDPMFSGPMQQIKYLYADNCSYTVGDLNMTAVLAEMWPNSVTGDILVNYLEVLPNTSAPGTGYTEGNFERQQTRGDGAARTLSWWNPTTKYTYYYNNVKYQGVGEEQLFVDHFTDFFNDTTKIETDTYDWAHYFPTPLTITDTNGHVTNQTLESTLGKLTQEKHPDTSHQDWTYTSTTAPFYVATKSDENSNVTTFTRDPTTHLVTQITYAGGAIEKFTYNSFGQVTDHQLASGAHETAVYGNTGLKKSSTDSVTGETTKYTYDSLDRLQTVKDPRAIALGLPYSEKFEYNGRNQITAIHYAAAGGSADPVVTYAYDGLGRCTSITDELNNTSTMVYDDYGRITSYTEPLNAPAWNGQGTVASRTWAWTYERVRNGTTYDPHTHVSKNWRTEIEPPYDANGDSRMTIREYDVNDRLSTETTGLIVQPNGSQVSGPDTETHSFTYDHEGNKLTYTDPMQRLYSYSYDTRNRLTQVTEPQNRITTTTLDYVGNKTKVTFPDSTTQQWGGYDAFGQPATFTDERGDITNLAYEWGPMKKLLTVTTHRDKDAGGTENQVTTFTYDGLGRATQTLFPDGTTEVTTYQYGDVLKWKTRKGATKTISYDNRGREAYHTWDDGVTQRIDQTWDDANRIASIWNVFSTIIYSYDGAGQVVTESNNVTGSSGAATISYARFPDGMPSLVTYPNGFGLRRDYTARGQLVTTGSADSSGNYLTQFVNYSYLADGKVNYEAYGNGVKTSYGYDPRGFVNNTNTFVVSSGATYSNRTYYRDTRDRITAWVKSSSTNTNPLENGRGDAYVYDPEGQLTSAKYEATTPNTTAGTPQRTESFIFDAMGNRKGVNQLAARGNVTFSRANTGLNEYSSWIAATPYDTNGSLTAEGWYSAVYDALNQPVSIASPSLPTGDSTYFGYDPLGRPVKRWNATTFVANANPATYLYYEGWDLIAEGSDSIAIARIYAPGNRIDEVVADSSDAGTTWAYHHFDARTHCIMLTDATGNLLEQYDYDAFGKVYYYDASGNSVTTSTWGNRFLFTGREWLSDLGVYDFRARLYHAELGRFVQPDPKEFSAGDYNIYRYCDNDPVNKSDPTGLGGTGPIIQGMGKGQIYYAFDSEQVQLTDGLLVLLGAGLSDPFTSKITYEPSLDPNKPNHMVKVSEKIVGSQKVVETQLTNDKGQKLTRNVTGVEVTKMIRDDFGHAQNTDGQAHERPLINGIFTDGVGPKNAPGNVSGQDIREQRFIIHVDGTAIPVSTVYRHETIVDHGNVTNKVILLTP